MTPASVPRAQSSAPGIMSASGIPIARSSAVRPLLIAAGIGCPVVAPSIANAQRFQLRKLTADDGLSGPWAPNIIQDSRGFMWFGTRRGLDRYDGYAIA